VLIPAKFGRRLSRNSRPPSQKNTPARQSAELKAKGEASLKPLKNRVRVIEIRGEQRDLHCLRPFFIGVLSV